MTINYAKSEASAAREAEKAQKDKQRELDNRVAAAQTNPPLSICQRGECVASGISVASSYAITNPNFVLGQKCWPPVSDITLMRTHGKIYPVEKFVETLSDEKAYYSDEMGILYFTTPAGEKTFKAVCWKWNASLNRFEVFDAEAIWKHTTPLVPLY